MFPSYLYWFIYRRRNKCLLILIATFCLLFYVYHDDAQVSTRQRGKPRKSRINRETYTTPEPCNGCPGENGQGVQLTVGEWMMKNFR